MEIWFRFKIKKCFPTKPVEHWLAFSNNLIGKLFKALGWLKYCDFCYVNWKVNLFFLINKFCLLTSFIIGYSNFSSNVTFKYIHTAILILRLFSHGIIFGNPSIRTCHGFSTEFDKNRRKNCSLEVEKANFLFSRLWLWNVYEMEIELFNPQLCVENFHSSSIDIRC